ncbi:hypothetical protein CDD83_9319 [Cordyceps sp. RAO-2017]|nr:hypothetical protein CDD83_9319 [Cordyceps sp. RAO-2017]
MRLLQTSTKAAWTQPIRAGLPRTPSSARCIGRRQLHLGSLGNEAVALTAGAFGSIHSVGVPWYLTIPLVAVAVNFSFRLPNQYYARRLVVKRRELSPLVMSWRARHFGRNPAVDIGGTAERLRQLRAAGLVARSARRIYKAWGVQRWKGLTPLLGLMPFVVVSDALRRLCSAPPTLAGDSSTTLSHTGSLYDPSLAQGGCLWFGDLAAMDPYYALPLLSSAILAASVWPKLSKDQFRALFSPNASNQPKPPIERMRDALSRAMIFMPVFPMLFAEMPSAIFLYWATSFGLGILNDSILNRLVPDRPPKLKPPVLMKTRGMTPFLRG